MFFIFLTFFLFASAISINKMILGILPPTLFVGLRMAISGILLLIYTFPKNRRFKWSYIKYDLFMLCAISLFTSLIPAILKAYAYKYLISSKAAFLGSLDPFVTALYAYILWHEKLTLQKVVGMVVGFAGTLILLWSSSSTELSLHSWLIFSYPECAALLSMALGRLGWMAVQKLLKQDRYSAMEINGISMFLGGFCALLIASYLQEPTLILNGISFKLTLLLTYTIIVGNLIAYTMYATMLKKYSATFVSLAGFSIPLFVYINGWLFLDEPLSLNFIISLIITFIGLLIFYQNEIHQKLWWKKKI